MKEFSFHSIATSCDERATKLELIDRGKGRSAVLFNGEVLAVGHGAVICAAARKLIRRGYDPAKRLEAWRGSTLCLNGLVGTFARLTVEDSDERLRFRSYRAPSGRESSTERLIPAEAVAEPGEAIGRILSETPHTRPP
jgi:hypothetical protein